MSQNMSSRGRNKSRASRGRPVTMGSNTVRCNVNKRPLAQPLRQTPPAKRVTTDRNSHTNNLNRTPKIVKYESLTSANKSPVVASQQDVVNLFSKRELTISTVDKVNKISLPAEISLNSAVSIIPTSPIESIETVDLTGEDERQFWPCESCSKTFKSIETLYKHVSDFHKPFLLSFKCNLCSSSFPNSVILNWHKQSFHKSEVTTNIPIMIPVLDVTKAGTTSKLQAMGVTNYVPVAQLDNQGDQFGIPIMSVSGPDSLSGLMYTNFFNLGSVQKL